MRTSLRRTYPPIKLTAGLLFLFFAHPHAIFMHDVTQLLRNIQNGDDAATDDLLPIVYGELRRIATRKMRNEKPGQTLSSTALVHEAYLRLIRPDEHATWDSRGHFFAAAAEAMRRILIDNARRKARQKHGGDRQRIDFDNVQPMSERGDELIALDEALDGLATRNLQACELVKLRFFAGLTIPQAAWSLGISESQAKRLWTYARAWLYHEMYD